MNKISKRYIFVLAILFLVSITSCDPHSDYKKIIINNSDYTIKIVGYSNPTGTYMPYDSFIVNPNNRITIRSNGRLGDAPPCVLNGDSIVGVLPNNSDLRIIKNFNSSENWVRNRTGSNNKGYFISCEAVITNSDIKTK